MPISAVILTVVLLHLAAFVSYPLSGRFGITFLFISTLLWSGLGAFLGRAAAEWKTDNRIILAIFFSVLCAFSALSFLPQKDGRSALRKFVAGKYPDKRALYIGLRNLGVDAPGLLPPAQEEKPI